MMIRGELVSARTFPARYTNTCWSFIETNDTVKVGGRHLQDRRERRPAQANAG